MKTAAPFALGVMVGVALALLLTQPTQSRQASTPRPAATILATLRPVAPLRTGAPIPVDRGLGGVRLPDGAPYPTMKADRPVPIAHVDPSASPIGTQPAGTEAQPPATTAAPTPTKRPVRPSEARTGVASFVAASYGADYLAARLPRGTRLRICGPVGCVTGTVNDYGPSKRIHPERVVDLSRADFAKVCGHPETLGVCDVTVEIR